MKSQQNCQEPEHCWWISRTVLRWYIEQKSEVVRDSGYPFLPFSILGSKGISCSCDILHQSCFTWFPLVLLEECGVLPASSSYARAGWGMLVLDVCWSSLLKTHACPSASQCSICVVAKAGIQMYSEKKTPKNRYLQCSTSILASAHLFRVNEGKTGNSRIPSHHIYFRPLPWGEVKTILEVLVSAVYKGLVSPLSGTEFPSTKTCQTSPPAGWPWACPPEPHLWFCRQSFLLLLRGADGGGSVPGQVLLEALGCCPGYLFTVLLTTFSSPI